MNYFISWEKGGIHVKFSGTVSLGDMTAPKSQFHGDARFEELKYSIWDYSGCENIKLTQEDLMTLVALDLGASFTLPRHKLAVVVTDPNAVKMAEEFIRQSKQSNSSWTFKVVPTLEEARSWVKS